MKVFMSFTGNISTDQNEVKALLGADFGCIYDSPTNTYNKEILDAYDGSNIGNLIVQLKSKGVDTIITSNMPLLTFSLCLEMGMLIYKAAEGSASENIHLLKSNQLKYFTAMDTIVQDDCMGACSKCSSACS